MADEPIVPEDVQTDEVQEEHVLTARPSTEANFFVQLLVGVLGTAAIALAVYPLKGTRADYVWSLISNRGPIQYIEIFMAFMVTAQVFLKQRIIRNQMRILYKNPIETKIDLNDDAQVQGLRKRIVEDESYSSSIMLSRMDRILGMWLSSKDVGRISTWASAESSRDTSFSDQSYALSRVLIWAIPILGFIGTVQGLGMAVSGFANFLAGAAELSEIKGAISEVTIGLGVAFDTTFLALMLVTFLMFPLTSLQRKEEGLFVEIDIYLDDVLVSRFPSPEQQPIVIENLEDSIEAAFRRYIPDPDRYDEVFTRSIERAAGAVEERFSNLTQSYEATLKDLTARLSDSFASVGQTLEGSLRKTVEDMKVEEGDLLQSRRKLTEEEGEKLKVLLSEVHGEALRMVTDYQKSASEIQEATRQSMTQSVSASQELGQRMAEVAKLAANIEALLRIEQAVEQGLKGIASSDEFRKTLEDLRQHLATTDSFCNRLSRPRVITLREEPAR